MLLNLLFLKYCVTKYEFLFNSWIIYPLIVLDTENRLIFDNFLRKYHRNLTISREPRFTSLIEA